MEPSEPLNPASAVDRPTAAGDVELSELNGSYPHTHTHIGIVCTGVCDIKPCLAQADQNRSPRCDRQTSGSFSERHMAPSVLRFGRCLRPWQVGRREAGPLLAPSSAGLKIQQQAASIREALFTRTMTSPLPVSILCSISAHHSCLLILLLSPFVVAFPPSSSSPSCSEVLPPLCSCQARKAWRLDVKNCPKFDFLMNKQCNGTSPFWIIYVLLLVFFFLIQSSALSLYLLALPPPSLFASQAVWHPAPSL